MSERPFFTYSIEALEKLFDSSRGNLATLQTLGAELLFRNSTKAAELLVRVQQAISVLPQHVEETDDVWTMLAQRLQNDERLLIARSPVLQPPVLGQQSSFWSETLEMSRYEAHMSIPRLKGLLRQGLNIHHNSEAYGLALKLGGFELRNNGIRGWPGFALLLRKLLGDAITPWLPSLFLAAVALPDLADVPEFDLEEVLSFRQIL